MNAGKNYRAETDEASIFDLHRSDGIIYPKSDILITRCCERVNYIDDCTVTGDRYVVTNGDVIFGDDLHVLLDETTVADRYFGHRKIRTDHGL